MSPLDLVLAALWRVSLGRPRFRKRRNVWGRVECLECRTVPATTPVITAITVDSGVNGDRITNDRTLLVTGTGVSGETVFVFRDGVELGTRLVNLGGTWTFSMTGTELPDGQYTLTARARDVAGSLSDFSAEFAVTIDGTATVPVLTSISTDSGVVGDGITNDPNLTLSGTAEAGAAVVIRRNGLSFGTTTADADGNWMFESLQTLPDGTHTFVVTATDLAGNPGVASFDLVIDTLAPPVPALHGVVENSGAVVLGGSTSDPHPEFRGTGTAGDGIELLIDAVVVGTSTVEANGAWSVTSTVEIAGGTHIVVVRAFDVAGNRSFDVASTFTRLAADNPPEPDDDFYTMLEDGVLEGDSVLGNDFDADGDPLTATLVDDVQSGTLELRDDGTFTYVPIENFYDFDTFTYTVSDGTHVSGPVTVVIQVFSVNDAPTDVVLDGNVVNEGLVTDALTVGRLDSIDVDFEFKPVFTLVSGHGDTDNARFQIVGDELQLRPGVLVDYERTTAYSVRVRVTDGEHTLEKTFTIGVTDVQEVVFAVGDTAANTFDPKSPAVSVTLLSTGTFDATQDVDVNSLTFGATGFEDSLKRNKKGPQKVETRDVNGDGLTDLVLVFETGTAGLDGLTTQATLRGALVNGDLFATTVNVQPLSKSKGKPAPTAPLLAATAQDAVFAHAAEHWPFDLPPGWKKK